MPEAVPADRSNPHSRPRPIAAFSLIELMIALAIAAIIAVSAVPSYRDHMLRAQIPEATSGLLLTAMRLEQHYQDHRSYARAGTGTGTGAAVGKDTAVGNGTGNGNGDGNGNGNGNGNCGVNLPASGKFAFSCEVPEGGQSFLLSATGQADTALAGFEYTLDHLGTQRTVSLPTDWGNSPVECWVERRNAGC